MTVAMLLAATALVATSVMPVAAITFSGNGKYARLSWSGGGGIVVTDKINNNEGRLNALLGGLVAGDDYVITGRSISCTGTPSNANRMWRVEATANSRGVVRVQGYKLENVLISSYWLSQEPGGQGLDCAASLDFEKYQASVHGPDSDGALAMKSGGDHVTLENYAVLVEDQPGGKARLSVIAGDYDLDGDVDGRDYLVSLSPRPCSNSSAASTASISVNNVVGSAFKSKVVNLSQAELDSLRSVRVKEKDSGEVACAPLSLLALLLP